MRIKNVHYYYYYYYYFLYLELFKAQLTADWNFFLSPWQQSVINWSLLPNTFAANCSTSSLKDWNQCTQCSTYLLQNTSRLVRAVPSQLQLFSQFRNVTFWRSCPWQAINAWYSCKISLQLVFRVGRSGELIWKIPSLLILPDFFRHNLVSIFYFFKETLVPGTLAREKQSYAKK